MATDKKTRTAYKNMLKDYPDVMDIGEMCAAIGGISRKTGYKLLREKKIDSIIIGNKYRVAKINVIDFLMNLE